MEAKYGEIILYCQFYYANHSCSCCQQEKFSATEKYLIYSCKTWHKLHVNETTPPNDSYPISLDSTDIFKENVFKNTLFFFPRYTFVVTYKILIQTN